MVGQGWEDKGGIIKGMEAKKAPPRPGLRGTRTFREINFMRVKRQKDFWLEHYRATGGDMVKACEALKVVPATVKGWAIRDEKFKADVAEVEQDLDDIAHGRVKGMVPRALDAVEAILTDRSPAVAPTRYRAAARVLENEGVLREGVDVAVDARGMNVYVIDNETRDLMSRVKERTGKLVEP